MNTPTRTQQIEDLRIEIATHVSFLERQGKAVSFQTDLLAHRQQIRENMRDDPAEAFWRDRLSLLDDICTQEGVA